MLARSKDLKGYSAQQAIFHEMIFKSKFQTAMFSEINWPDNEKQFLTI